MNRHRILYLFIALALLLAPMAAYAAPTPAGFDAAGANVGALQPAAPANEAKPQDAACALLDNAKVRGMMSGMFETKLLIACGRQNELGQVKSQDTFGGEAIQGLAPLLGTDVLVNDPTLDTSGTSHTQSETSLTRNETNGTLCSAYNDSYSGVTQGIGYTGFSRSTDGGATWSDRGAIPQGGGGQSFGDPSVVWRKCGRRLLHHHATHQWSGPVEIHSTTAIPSPGSAWFTRAPTTTRS